MNVTANASKAPATAASVAVHRARVLPPPSVRGGMPLMEAMSLRRSSRTFGTGPLSLQHISNILWAAAGINRPSGGDRTTPAWRHIAAISVYVATPDGLYRYSPEHRQLIHHLSADLRAMSGEQEFAGTAPLDLIYVAHGDMLMQLEEPERRLVASVDAAFMGQNVYLYCAANGLATVFRGAIDYPTLTAAMQLGPDEFVTFAQTIGHPRYVQDCPSSLESGKAG